jgi:AcrR family transcriptional regulator
VALRCFATWGYEGTSVRRIADEAHVAPGLLYHYFPSKEAVLQALFERSAGMVVGSFARVAEEPDAPRRLAALLRVSAEIVRENQEFWRVSYGVRLQHAVVAGLGDLITTQSVMLHGAFQALLAEIGRPNPEVEAVLLFAAVDGVFQHYVLDPDRYPLDAVIESLIQHFGGAPPSEAT